MPLRAEDLERSGPAPRRAAAAAERCAALRRKSPRYDPERASRDLRGAPFHRARRTPRSRHQGTDRCHRPRGPGQRLRLRSLVLPRRVAPRAGADRSRVHRRRRGNGQRSARHPEGRFRRRAFHVQRRHLPALPRRLAVELRPRRIVREPRRRRRPGRSRALPFRGFDARQSSGFPAVGRGHDVARRAHGRHVPVTMRR